MIGNLNGFDDEFPLPSHHKRPLDKPGSVASNERDKQ